MKRTGFCSIAIILAAFSMQPSATAQTSYQAQLRGLVQDGSGAVVAKAKVTITDVGTNQSRSATTDSSGIYSLRGLRPSEYVVKVESAGFQVIEQKGVVLAVDQDATLNFTVRPASAAIEMEIKDTAPLLDTESAALGTDITNEYVKDIPLYNRSFFGLAFLAGGVTETAGSGTADSYPSGTNFVSNGQRNATAEVRIDGALISAPEQGEGASTNVYYEPSVEIIQEFKVESNSFSSEFGNNGGTVVNMVLKSGTNKFHGSGWWFLQRSGTDARDFFNPAPGLKPDHVRDQYGFSVGGPIRKDRTFFFVDFEKVRDNEPINYLASVPTLAERTGDFSQAANPIFDPLQCISQGPNLPCLRNAVPGNIIPAGEIDKVGQAIINLYPKPNLPGEFNNFRLNSISHAPGYQFDIKVDHQINDSQRIAGRFSHAHADSSTPSLFGDSEFGPSGDGIGSAPINIENVSLEYSWTLTPKIIWSSRASVDRAKQISSNNLPSLTSVGFPSYLAANGFDRMPTIQISGNSPWTSLYDQCCIDTHFAHTLFSYSSKIEIVSGNHIFKFGGEQRLFYNNFFQPPNPTGLFNFTDDVTSDTPNTNAENGTQGNPFASILFGFPDNSSILNIYPSVATKSKETGFYFQDDWKITPKLTLNLGLRYEWSTPYNERHNQLQFSDFAGNSGVTVPGLPITGPLQGTTLFPSGSNRSVSADRNNFGPRLGFAYQLDDKTVVRGGAGVYYGLSVATNFQYTGTAFRKTATAFFTNDNFATRDATLADPFHGGVTPPQGQTYGPLAQWGYINQNDLGTTQARNADIYQWNLGIQRLLPSQLVIGVDYSANRSTHLPWGGYASTRNRNYISSSLLAQISAQQHALDPNCDADSCVSNYLANPVANPFCTLFNGVGCLIAGPAGVFNEPDSRYNQQTIPQVNLLRPYPQFDGNFEGLPLLEANSWYHSMQIRFQKRTTHYVSFEGNYTLSKSTDDSSIGANAFVGTLNNGNPQQLDRLNREHGISANDATHRLAVAVIFDIPVGKDRWIGRDMNRIGDALIGGWAASTIVSEQSGQPLPISIANGGRLQDGNQRPNVLCGGLTGISADKAAVTQQPYLNSNCFADPGDQMPGDAPRYFSNLRTEGIHNFDTSFYKEFTPHEGMKLQVRAEMFNFFNHPRFAPPNTAYNLGDLSFGTITSTASGANPRRMQFGARFEF